MLKPFDPATIDFYNAEAPDYMASGRGGVGRHLPDFIARLGSGAKVLELGCGGGRDSERMIAAGLDVEPTDGSEGMARQAEQRLGRPVRVMRFEELDAVETYDAVWAHASLLHVPRDALPDIISRVHRALKPGGLHYANFKAGGTGGRDQMGRYYNYLSLDQAQDFYRQSGGWEFVEAFDYEGGGYDGKMGPWVALTVRKL